MVWLKRVLNSESGDADHVGGDDWDNLDKYFDNTDITSALTNPTKINTPTTYRDQILKIMNAGSTASYTIKAGTISSNQTLTLPDLSGTGTLVAAGGANDWGTAAQTFRSTFLIMRNPANTSSYVHTTSAIAANRVVTWPLLTSDDEVMFKAFAQTPTNKTWHINTNTIKHSTTNAQGDILYYDVASGKYIRLPKGTADQVLAVNSGGTDIGWATVSAGAGGDADEIKVYEGGVQVGSVARKLDFNTTDFNVTEDGGGNKFTVALASAATPGITVYDRSLSSTDIVSTTSKTTLYSFTVTGNDLSTNKILEIDIFCDYLNNTGSSRASTVFVEFGSTTLWTDAMGSFSSSSTRRVINMKLFLANKDSASIQEFWGEMKVSLNAAPTTGIGSGDDGDAGMLHPIGLTSGGSTENTATNKTFTVSIQHPTSSASLSWRKRSAVTKIM